MGVETSKLKCLLLPAQSGKTRKVEEQITLFNYTNELFGLTPDVNIWISANNKLLVHQTASRFRNDLGESDEDGESNAVIQGTIFSWTSGTKQSNISPKELAFEVLDTVDMVILCAHPARIRYCADMLGHLANHRACTKRINIWIDEADHTINLWSKYSHILSYSKINQVTLVSATFDSVCSRFGRLHILPYAITHPPCYRRLKDAVQIIEDVAKSKPATYIHSVLTKHASKLIRAGVRAFLPGDHTKQSHEDIASMLLELGFAVIVLNGSVKELRIPMEEVIDLRPYLTVSDPDTIPHEFNITLARMYKENNLAAYPFAITGFMCVERGITFQCPPATNDHDGFLFDYGIIPPISDKAEAYQTMARLFGNIGYFPTYKPCEIYTNSATFKRVHAQEEIAVNLARMVSEQGLVDVGCEHFEEAGDPNEYKRKEVPIVVPMDADVIEVINGLSHSEKQTECLNWLAKTHPDMASRIQSYIVKKIICPREIYSKKRHIDTNIRAAERNQKIVFNLKPDDHFVNNWQCILDQDGERAIYSIYHGELGR